MHAPAGSDDGVLLRVFTPDGDRLGGDLAGVCGTLDEIQEVRHFKGLDEVIKGPLFSSLDGPIGGAEGGHHDDGKERVTLMKFLQQLHPAHARHAVVGEDEMEVAFFCGSKCGFAIIEMSDGVAPAFEDRFDGVGMCGIVIDEKDVGGHFVRECLVDYGAEEESPKNLLNRFESDGKGGSFSFGAFAGDPAVVGFYDIPADGETEAGACFLFAEKGIENAVEVFPGDAGAVVDNGEDHIFTGSLGREDDFTTFGAGFGGIANEIEEDLFELFLIEPESGLHSATDDERDIAGAHLREGKGMNFFEEFRYADAFQIGLGGACEAQEVLDDALHAVGFILNGADLTGYRFIFPGDFT